MEEWRTVEDFPAYEVSNTGLVRRRATEALIAGHILQNGYRQVGLFRDKKPVFRVVHRLVIVAFRGAVPQGMEVNHKDGDKRNNHIDNLEFVTHRQNMRHARIELEALGRKLIEADVTEIRRRLAAGERQKALSKMFGVSLSMVSYIATNRLWADDAFVRVDRRKKLTAEKVAQINQRLANGEVHARIAEAFNVSDSTIDNIANQKSWHLADNPPKG